MFEVIRKFFLKIDDIREDIEYEMSKILNKLQGSEAIDDVEKKLIVKGIQTGITYFVGTCVLTDEQLLKIAEPIVESGINKINPPIAQQLAKKSKSYERRHNKI